MLTSLKELNLRVNTVKEKVPHFSGVQGCRAGQDLLHGFQALLLQFQHGLPQFATLLLRKDKDSGGHHSEHSQPPRGHPPIQSVSHTTATGIILECQCGYVTALLGTLTQLSAAFRIKYRLLGDSQESPLETYRLFPASPPATHPHLPPHQPD